MIDNQLYQSNIIWTVVLFSTWQRGFSTFSEIKQWTHISYISVETDSHRWTKHFVWLQPLNGRVDILWRFQAIQGNPFPEYNTGKIFRNRHKTQFWGAKKNIWKLFGTGWLNTMVTLVVHGIFAHVKKYVRTFHMVLNMEK